MPRLNVGDIPGYAEAVAHEAQMRELAYVGSAWIVCGVPIATLTPRMMAELFAVGCPFLSGGYPTAESIVHLLIVCGMSAEDRKSRFKTWRFTRRISKAIRDLKWGVVECSADVEQYIDAMFQDAPTGGGKSIPYASSVAWLEFSMCGKPWGWSRDTTLDTPIPIIYQQLRCLERSRGHSPINQSDYIRARWLEKQSGGLS